MKIAVGSTNPVKIEAVKLAFEAVWPEHTWIVEGVSVPSGVPDQPLSDHISIQGARNRAKAARDAAYAAYGVGLEGGLHKTDNIWFNCGWVVVVDTHNTEGIGSTIKMETPGKLMELIRAGKELGEANDLVFGVTNSKHNAGHFGLMTNNAITRLTGYRDGVIAALARFIQSPVFTR